MTLMTCRVTIGTCIVMVIFNGACQGHKNDLVYIVDNNLRFELVFFMVFNATVNDISGISWQSVLLVAEPAASG